METKVLPEPALPTPQPPKECLPLLPRSARTPTHRRTPPLRLVGRASATHLPKSGCVTRFRRAT